MDTDKDLIDAQIRHSKKLKEKDKKHFFIIQNHKLRNALCIGNKNDILKFNSSEEAYNFIIRNMLIGFTVIEVININNEQENIKKDNG